MKDSDTAEQARVHARAFKALCLKFKDRFMSVFKTQSCSFLSFNLKLKAFSWCPPQSSWLWKTEVGWGMMPSFPFPCLHARVARIGARAERQSSARDEVAVLLSDDCHCHCPWVGVSVCPADWALTPTLLPGSGGLGGLVGDLTSFSAGSIHLPSP